MVSTPFPHRVLSRGLFPGRGPVVFSVQGVKTPLFFSVKSLCPSVPRPEGHRGRVENYLRGRVVSELRAGGFHEGRGYSLPSVFRLGLNQVHEVFTAGR